MKFGLIGFLFLFGVFSLSMEANEPLPDFDDHLAVVEWIFEEDDPGLQRNLVWSFVRSLPKEKIGEACQKIWELDGSQTAYENIFLEWAAKDPKSAWPIAFQFLEICSDDHFSDDWAEIKIGPDPDAVDDLKKSAIWPSVWLTEQFLGVVESNGAKHTPEGREKVAAFRKRFLERIDREPNAKFHRDVGREISPYFSDVVLILTCPLEDVPPMLKVKALSGNPPATAFGWRRLANDDPAAALKMEGADAYEILKIWAKNSPETLFEASQKFEDESLKDLALSYLLADGGTEAIRKKAAEEIRKKLSDENDRWDFLEPLTCRSPQDAVDFILASELDQSAKAYLINNLLVYCFDDVPPAKRDQFIDIFFSHDPILSDDYAYILIESWGEIDVGEAARYCVSWHLASQKKPELTIGGSWRSWPREHLITVWSGSEYPDDASMDDRAFGTLRKWALCEPDEMRKWIDTIEDEGLQQALIWLHGNAAGLPEFEN